MIILAEKDFVKEITNIEDDFSKWYLDIVQKADLMDYAPVKGTMVIKPYGYAIWELMQKQMDQMIKDTGAENAYFPLFIPESLLKKEMEHVEGFAPEVAWVTHGGNEELAERLVVRPTSETIICYMMSQWIHSYRDLPLLLNQWANVVRWEKATRPFLRTSEFLWQEGHTAHANNEEAERETLQMLEVYRRFAEEVLAMPVIVGKKTDNEKFAGAMHTYSIEALMQDGKALQAGTSHNLGTHFSQVFNIQFTDENNQLQYVHQTSWGSSTRMVGGLIMTHSDNRGLKLPPKVAPIQVIIIPILKGDKELVLQKANEIAANLKTAGVRVKVDAREEQTPGWKFNEYEMRGVPVRIEIGPRDIANQVVMIARRDTGEKATMAIDTLSTNIPVLLEDIQENMFKMAKKYLDEHTFTVNSIAEMNEQLEKERGFLKGYWCGDISCLDEVKKETGATPRNMPFNEQGGTGKCVCCGKEAKTLVYFARAY